MRRSVRVTGCSWPGAVPRPGSVTSSASAASCAASWRASSASRRASMAAASADFRVVDRLAGRRNLRRRQLADLAQLRREHALLAEELHAHGVERGQVLGRAHGRFGLAQQFRDAAHRELPDVRGLRRRGESLFRGGGQRRQSLPGRARRCRRGSCDRPRSRPARARSSAGCTTARSRALPR